MPCGCPGVDGRRHGHGADASLATACRRDRPVRPEVHLSSGQPTPHVACARPVRIEELRALPAHPPPLAVAGHRLVIVCRARIGGRGDRQPTRRRLDRRSTTAARTTATSRSSSTSRRQRDQGRAAGRHRARALRAAAPRRQRHAGRRARDDRPRQPVAGRGCRPAPAESIQPKLRGQHARRAARPRRPVVGAHARGCACRWCRPSESPQGEVTSYEDLGDPKYKGRTCLRTSNNEYNQSLVADMIAKRGRAATEALLRSWMANDPKILNSDGELLAVIAAGDCDVGLSNHYYLGSRAPGEPELPGRAGLARPGRRRRARERVGRRRRASGPTTRRGAIAAASSTSRRRRRSRSFTTGGEFAANPHVPPAEHIARLGGREDRPDRRRARRTAARGRDRAHARGGLELTSDRSRPERPTRAARRASAAPADLGLGGRLAARSRSCSSRRCSRSRRASSADGFGFDRIARLLLPDALRTSLRARGRRGRRHAGRRRRAGASLVSFYDFPGRRWLDWALVLPMAMPGLRARVRRARPVRAGQPAPVEPVRRGCEIPGIRTTARRDLHPHRGALPVRVRARPQRVPRPVPPDARGRAIARAAPTARPSGASRSRWRGPRSPAAPPSRSWRRWPTSARSNLLGVQALTNAIYRVWNGAFDEAAGAAARHRAAHA